MRKLIFSIIVLISIFSNSYGYTDITSEYWAYNSINSLSKEGILTGYPEGDFRPEENMSRAEFITILSKIVDLDIDYSINSDYWADKYIEAANKRGIFEYEEYSEFKPDGDITRWEMCKMIANSFENTKNAAIKSKTPVFLDINEGNLEEMRVASVLKEAGVLSGYPDGTIGFSKSSTRAEVSCFMDNVMKKIDILKNYGIKSVYENNISVSNINDGSIRLKKYEFAEDNEYCTTIISKIKMFEFNKAFENGYKDIFEQIYNENDPYLSYRNKFGKENYVLAIEFKTQNNTKEYEILTGYPFLHISFDEKENITVIDSFDADEIYNQINKKTYDGVFVKPGEIVDTSAFYVLDKLPLEKIYVDRVITTLYDNQNMENIEVNSFHSAVIYL